MYLPKSLRYHRGLYLSIELNTGSSASITNLLIYIFNYKENNDLKGRVIINFKIFTEFLIISFSGWAMKNFINNSLLGW